MIWLSKSEKKNFWRKIYRDYLMKFIDQLIGLLMNTSQRNMMRNPKLRQSHHHLHRLQHLQKKYMIILQKKQMMILRKK